MDAKNNTKVHQLLSWKLPLLLTILTPQFLIEAKGFGRLFLWLIVEMKPKKASVLNYSTKHLYWIRFILLKYVWNKKYWFFFLLIQRPTFPSKNFWVKKQGLWKALRADLWDGEKNEGKKSSLLILSRLTL